MNLTDEETPDDQREQLREAIRGAFYSLAEEDKGLQTHMVAAYVEYYMAADHDDLSPQQQVGIIGLVHKAIVQMLHINPSSLQMAHAHAYIHALADTYLPDDDEEDEDEDEPDVLLEESADDLAAWADELAQYMQEKQEEGPDGEGDSPTDDAEPDPGGDSEGQ